MRNTSFTELTPAVTVTLTLPSKHEVSASHSRILILDGEEPSYLSKVLQEFGYESDVFPNSAQALEYLACAKGISGVLLDIRSVVPANMAVLTQLRDRHPQIPVITMARVTHLSLLRRSIELGASEYLVVPIDPQLLNRKCAMVFFRRSQIASMNQDRQDS